MTNVATRPSTWQVASPWALGAAFGLVPSLLPVSWVGALIVGLVSVILVQGWKVRAALTLFVAAEVCGLPWPTAPILAAALYFALTPGTLHRRWRDIGSTTRPRVAWTLVILIAIVAGIAVVALDWTNIRGGYTFAFPVPPPWAFSFVALGAALLNTLGEEALWRGLLADVSGPLIGLRAAFIVQSLSFGLAHLHGIPNGPIGVIAAGVYSALVYGISLRRGARGALVAHFLTDLVIFVVVVHFAQFAWNG